MRETGKYQIENYDRRWKTLKIQLKEQRRVIFYFKTIDGFIDNTVLFHSFVFLKASFRPIECFEEDESFLPLRQKSKNSKSWLNLYSGVSLNCKIKSVFQIASVMNRHYKWEGETLILRDFNETENLNLKYWLKIVLNKNWSAETLYCVNCFWKKSCTVPAFFCVQPLRWVLTILNIFVWADLLFTA